MLKKAYNDYLHPPKPSEKVSVIDHTLLESIDQFISKFEIQIEKNCDQMKFLSIGERPKIKPNNS